MLKDITEAVKNMDHDVRVLTTAVGSTEEEQLRKNWTSETNIDIHTLKLGSEKQHGIIRKSFNAVYYGVWVFFSLIFHRSDVVMVATTPPIVIAALVRWASYFRKFKYVYHCQDIHPEAMLLNSNIQKGFLYNLLLKIDSRNIDHAWRVITLSEDMKNTFRKRGCRTEHIYIINNFAFEKAEPREDNDNSKNHVRFLFAGSLGRFQNLDMLMQALVNFRKRSDVEFVFMGDGILRDRMEEIKNNNQLNNVQILGQKSVQEAVLAMQNADMGIVSIASGICDVAYPSKAIMYLGSGLPILALVDEDSELWDFIIDNEIGVTISLSSESAIVSGIMKAIEKCKTTPFSRKHIESVATNYFGKRTTLEKFSKVFTL